MSETDDHGNVSNARKVKAEMKRYDGPVDEEDEKSDGDMEEAGGRDE